MMYYSYVDASFVMIYCADEIPVGKNFMSS